VKRSIDLAKNKIVGNPYDPNTTQGPQIDEAQMNKILQMIESGKKDGANLVTGGSRFGDKGFFIQPTVFADVKDDMTFAKEEVMHPELVKELLENSTTKLYSKASGFLIFRSSAPSNKSSSSRMWRK
jgi:aldehyde dehydrogenase (NAD+)